MCPEDDDTLKCFLHFLDDFLRFCGPFIVAIAHRIEMTRRSRHNRRKSLRKDFDHA